MEGNGVVASQWHLLCCAARLGALDRLLNG